MTSVSLSSGSIIDLFLFFFFQAEDGIRDYKVTGVQTCALPISHKRNRFRLLSSDRSRSGTDSACEVIAVSELQRPRGARTDAQRNRRRIVEARSEERRVGKECRSRWSPYH